MATVAVKHSKEALAFLTLFKAMKPEIKKEVRDMLMAENGFDNDLEIASEDMTAASAQIFDQIWDAPENEPWDDFIKARLQCTNKET